MEENEKKWCVKALMGAGIGFVIGAIIKHILAIFLDPANQEIFLFAIIPVAMIIGLTVVHRLYQKEKEENFS